MSKKNAMTPDAARRIQSNTDRNGGGDGFKERAQRASDHNARNPGNQKGQKP
ncbi:MAG: hypothetical protein R3F65_27075 [bacterium]